MGLNRAKGNMYQGWITHTWNTVKGKCQHDCSYCYMKKWGELNPVRFDNKELKTDLGNGNKIFVGSSCDMFAWDVPKEWIFETLDYLKNFDNEYLFQSKNVQKMLAFSGNMPERSIVCTTIETNREYPEIMRNSPPVEVRAKSMSYFPERFKIFITGEPLLKFDVDEYTKLIKMTRAVQVNLGADSSPKKNNLPEPLWREIEELKAALETFTVVKMKENIWRLSK